MTGVRVGFTGTRRGMTERQLRKLKRFLERPASGIVAFHHGDCVGADAQAHALVERTCPAVSIFIHPPSNGALRAFSVVPMMHESSHGHVFPPAPYMTRNRAIVDACDVLIATPNSTSEAIRSGTWATVRYARIRGVPVHIFRP